MPIEGSGCALRDCGGLYCACVLSSLCFVSLYFSLALFAVVVNVEALAKLLYHSYYRSS